jgi:hypothetical protein
MAKSTKSAAVVASPLPTVATPVVATPVAKVHALQVGAATVVAANHVATFKGTRPVAQGGTTYSLTGNGYNPAQGHVNALQWAAVTKAIATNGGSATVAQVAAEFAASGLAPGLASGFVTYRAKGARPNLAPVAQ